MSDCKSSLAATSLVAILLFTGTTLAAASAEKVLYAFKGGDDGAHPQAPLVAGAAGNLYGTTGEGGSSNCQGGCGTVFQLTPPARRNGEWIETILYRFLGGHDGAGPLAGLIFDKAGNLYGATLSGGGSNDGTVFELSPPTLPGGAWKETVLYRFTGGDDGEYPLANLTFDPAGNLYGTTFYGGPFHAGVVFQLVPPTKPGATWTETVLHRFGSGDDGADPMSALLIDRHGVLYGTTALQFSSGGGVFFRLKPPPPGKTQWTETVLYQFDGQTVGNWPGDLIFDRTNHLYGTNKLGGDVDNCGTVFELIPPAPGGAWTATVLHNFAGGSDGNLPAPRLVADRAGNLYGTSLAGSPGFGTVFKLIRPTSPGGAWVKTTLHQFTSGSDGSAPAAGLIFGKLGALYSTTYYGGASDNGTVYAVVP